MIVAIVILIIVVIIIACCLTKKLKCNDKSVYIAASPIHDISMDDDTGSNSDLSLRSSIPQYDYIVNTDMISSNNHIRMALQKSDSNEGSNDCTVQQNVAYTTNNSRPKIVKSPNHDDYVVFVP